MTAQHRDRVRVDCDRAGSARLRFAFVHFLSGDHESAPHGDLRVLEVNVVQTQGFATSIANSVGLGIGKVRKVYGPVDSVLIDQDSFWTSFVAAPTFWSGLVETLNFRVLVMSSNVIGTSKALVGAFQSGAVIRERDTSVAFSEEHSDYFIKNKLAVRAERREAFIVNVPSWFCDVELA